MLGWMIKRGLDGGRDATDVPDDTQIEQPDTPGPVFAARAFKSALFGTPARPSDIEDEKRPADDRESKPPGAALPDVQNTKNVRDTKDTPGRLPGILLTPGTATSRRKRVSFGHNVEHDGAHDKKAGFKIDKTARRPNLFGDSRNQTRTKPAQALGSARSQDNKTSRVHDVTKEQDDASTKPDLVSEQHGNDAADDNLWEEVDDIDNDSNDWDPDVTVDLNEPHSQSGRYWKSQFQRYQEDAKVEMSKLLKYKQLAKSYAKMKDTEASDMHAKLREEKNKVTQMEGRITELASQIARKRMKGTDRDYQELIGDLTRQTALAVQYRNQVKELEAMLQDKPAEDLQQQNGSEEVVLGSSSRRQHHTAATGTASPRTQKTLVDTQRELRRARDQAKELAQVKEEVRRLKTALRAAEKRALKSESESKSLAADLASSEASAEAATQKVRDLEKRAKFAEDERGRKDDELRLLQRKYDSLKDDAKARVGEAEQVLRRKNEQIAELKRQVRQAAMHKPEDAPVEGHLLDLDGIDFEAKADNKEIERPDNKSPTAPTNLAALEKLTRNRYESLRNKRSLEQKNVPAIQKSNAGLGGLVINADDLHFDPVEEPELPQQKLHRQQYKSRQPQKQEPITILEDENSSHFELPPMKPLPTTTTAARSTLSARTRLNETKRKEDDNDDDEAVSAAKLILLRRRRGAESLRPITSQQKGPLESIDTNGINANATSSNKGSLADEAKPDALGRAARRGEPSAAKRKTATAPYRYERDNEWDAEDPVAAAAAAAADASRLSMSSDRAAAAVARIEKRRAERKRDLERLRNKENMQPA